jgi:uncharacterized protein (DUF488 family)
LPPRLATIGYEHDPQAEVIRKLKDAGVEVVIDVRAVPSSRRAGFSKNIFAASLKEAGIDYRHLKALGTPKPGREAARAGRVSEMEAIFEAHMQEPEAQFQLQEAGEIAFAGQGTMFCCETDPACCHRRIVADKLRAKLGLQVVDL